MRIQASFSTLKQTKATNHVMRFALGGAITLAAGLVAKKWGPVLGGLFLAFPAIFPVGATLIESDEVKKKRRIGSDGKKRGRQAAALDASGATLGSIGLGTFALVLWWLLPKHNPATSLALALVAWVGMSAGLWIVRKPYC